MHYKLSILAVLLGAAAIVLSADKKSTTPEPEAEGTIRVFRRIIPADVLRGSSTIVQIDLYNNNKIIKTMKQYV